MEPIDTDDEANEKGTEGLNFKQLSLGFPRTPSFHLAELDAVLPFDLVAKTIVAKCNIGADNPKTVSNRRVEHV